MYKCSETYYFVFHCEMCFWIHCWVQGRVLIASQLQYWRWMIICIPSTLSAEPLSVCLLLWHKPLAMMFGERQVQHSCRWFTSFPLTPVCTSHSQANATASQTEAHTKGLKEAHMFQWGVAFFYKASGFFHLLLSSSGWLWHVKTLTVITLEFNS